MATFIRIPLGFIPCVWLVLLVTTPAYGGPPPAPTPLVSKTAQDLAEGRMKRAGEREKALPPVISVDKPKDSIDDAFGMMFVSNKVKTSFDGKRVISGKDISDFEFKDIRDIVEENKDATFQFDPEVPVARRFLIHVRYHPGDEEAPEILKEAAEGPKKAAKSPKPGYGLVGQTSFLDDALDVKDFGGEPELKHLNKDTVQPKKDANGKVIQDLLDAGFKYATDGVLPSRFIAGPPIKHKKDKNDRSDLEHRKIWVVGELDPTGKKVQRAHVILGTANEVQHSASSKGERISTRYNRSFSVKDPDLAVYIAQTVINNSRQYASAIPIRKLDNPNRFRANFKDGWVEQGFTVGAHNLNARWTAIMLHAVKVKGSDGKMRVLTQEEVEKGFDKDVSEAFREYKDLSGWVPTEKWDSDFVETHSPTSLKAEKMLFEQYPHLRGNSHGNNAKVGNSFKLVDAKFATDIAGWGLVTAQGGLDLIRSMGGTVFGWGENITPDTYVYLRGTGAPEEDEDGAPIARILEHDKSGGMAGTLNGKPIAFMRTGSFNESNAEGNGEDQRIFKFDNPESWIYKGTRESVQSVIRDETKYAIPFRSAIRIANVASLTGRGLLEVDRELADTIWEQIEFGEFDKAAEALKDLAKKKTNLKKKVPPAELARRIEQFIEFAKWDQKNRKGVYGERGPKGVVREPAFRVIKLADVVGVITKTFTPGRIGMELRGLEWFPNAKPEEIEKLAETAWEKLGFPGKLPAKQEWHPDDQSAGASTVADGGQKPAGKGGGRKPARVQRTGKPNCDPAKMAQPPRPRRRVGS